jgi:hypothetical protein
MKVDEKTLSFFPELRGQIFNRDRQKEEKAFIYRQACQLLYQCPIHAILSLQVDNREESVLEPIESQEVIAPLTVSTLWQLTHTGTSTFTHLKRLAEALPCYRLRLGRDLTTAPQLIRGLL